MCITHILALIPPDTFPGAVYVALTLTAAIVIPTGVLFALLQERMAAKISNKRPDAPASICAFAVDRPPSALVRLHDLLTHHRSAFRGGKIR